MATVAMLATIADLGASQKAGSVSSLVPSGVIFPFAGSTTPSGWIVCDGTAYSQADYPELFAALGSTYNTQVNPTTGAAYAAPSAGQFRVPDMRGLFLRGEGTASGGDAVSVGGHQVGKTAKNGLGNAASGISALSLNGMNQNASHNHGTDPNDGTTAFVVNGGGGAPANITTTGGGYAQKTGTGFRNVDHVHTLSSGTAAAQTITGDNETRPVNRGVS